MKADRNRALLDWYDEHRRTLPWRRTTDPWAILVSEVMSQQTQIGRVAEAWSRFMDAYPTPSDLAAADTAEAIGLWAGLGYQRRLFNLIAASKQITEQGWPTDAEGLRTLPGVGPYTAAAVACFAFDATIAAVDTNLKRILSRWHGRPLSGADLALRAHEELDGRRPADWNQALMDLGAGVCRPTSPVCEHCPVEAWCVDPTVYEAPPRQPAYEGSVRQARASILRQLAAEGPLPRTSIAAHLDTDTVERAIEALTSEGLVRQTAGVLAVA